MYLKIADSKNSWKIHSLYQTVILPMCEAVNIYHLLSIVHQMIITLNYYEITKLNWLTGYVKITRSLLKSYLQSPLLVKLCKIGTDSDMLLLKHSMKFIGLTKTHSSMIYFMLVPRLLASLWAKYSEEFWPNLREINLMRLVKERTSWMKSLYFFQGKFWYPFQKTLLAAADTPF